jgi:hypothetical protein
MVEVKETGWLEFDVINAVQLGKNNKNLNLVVELEDQDKIPLDAKQYFDNFICQG